MSTLYWSLRETIQTTPALYWSLREAASWLKNLCTGQNRAQCHHLMFISVVSEAEMKKYRRITILVTSQVVLTRTWRITTRMRSAECVGFCQRLCLVVRVDLMFVTAGNETDRAHKIWQERLLAWNIFPQVMLEFIWWNKRIRNHGCRICVSN